MPNFSDSDVYREEFFVFFIFAISLGARSKVSQTLAQGVRVLLCWCLGEENGAKEILQREFVEIFFLTFCNVGRRSFPREMTILHRDYDDTKGFPGEDLNT